jgi:integrase
MVNVRARQDNGLLFLDFRLRGVRCRELTALKDTADNRRRLQTLANRIQKEIAQGSFEYAAHFPNSPRVERFSESAATGVSGQPQATPAPPATDVQTPTFADFAELWFLEMSPQWRRTHQQGVREALNTILLPAFGTRMLHGITKADVLGFRAELAKRPGRKSATVGAARINKIMCFLRQILNEAADRFEFTPAFRNVKPLKQKRTDVQPFSLDEVQRILDTVRPDYRDYLTVRFFTGMRSGEINGLKWRNVDLERNLILVRESVVGGQEEGGLKTENSLRDIAMLPMVREAIDRRLKARDPACPFVFSSSQGNPIDAHNFCNRVWYPLLRYLDLEARRPYQTRHTAATLMLGAGENPEWIAQTLGHSSTAMLFKVYSRFVPNLTRQDGQAFSGLVHSRLNPATATQPHAPGKAAAANEPLDDTAELADRLSITPEQLTALLAIAKTAS